MKDKRFFRTQVGNLTIMSDFGDKKGDYAVELICYESKGKVKVLSTKTMGSSENWNRERVEKYISNISV